MSRHVKNRKIRGRVGALVAMALVVGSAAPAAASGMDFSFVTRWVQSLMGQTPPAPQSPLERVRPRDNRFAVSESDWATFERMPVAASSFREQVFTEGRLAIDELSAVPVISPYSGRVIRILAVPGDQVRRGQTLFTLEANDMVQAQNDYAAAHSALDKSQTQLRLAEINERRQRDLFAGRASTQRDLDQARADLDSARADARAAATALEAVENRLRLFGKTNEDIAAFRSGRHITPDVAINAPIEGTIVARKIGPGQFINNTAAEPVFVIDDLDTLWLNMYVREDDAPRVAIGAPIEFRIVAFRDRVFTGKVDYVAPSIDADNRRLLVRATVQNVDRALKQQMFVTAAIQIGEAMLSPSIPRNAIVYEGSVARVWVAHPDRTVELRRIRTAAVRPTGVQVVEGLNVGEEVVVRGALFIDQMTAAFRR